MSANMCATLLAPTALALRSLSALADSLGIFTNLYCNGDNHL
jgi:hypothetical protein